MLVSGGPIAQHGIIKDVADTELPDGAWSDGLNVRFEDGYVKLYHGHEQGVLTDPPVSLATAFMMPVPSTVDTEVHFWLHIAGTIQTTPSMKAYVYNYNGGAHTDITRSSGGDYTTDSYDSWVGDIISGIPVICNGHNDAPQVWQTLTTATKLTPLPYVTGTSDWDGLGYTCGSIRTFDQFLVAVDVDKGTRDPYMLKWSHPATPGTLPASWDETDTTKKARERTLDKVGRLIDSSTMGNTHIIYGEYGMYGMQFIGGPLVFRTFKLPINIGLMNKNCVKPLKGGHVVFTQDFDLVFHDGRSATSILDERMRNHLIDDVEPPGLFAYRPYMVHNHIKKEIWVLYALNNNSASSNNNISRAVVWNYKNDTVTKTKFNGGTARFAEYGVVDSADKVYKRLLFGRMYGSQWAASDATSIDSSFLTSEDHYVERTGITLGDPKQWKNVTAVWLKMKSGGKVRVEIGGAESPYDTYTWEDAVLFDPATDGKRVEIQTHYPYLGIRFRHDKTAANDFQISSFDWEFEFTGER